MFSGTTMVVCRGYITSTMCMIECFLALGLYGLVVSFFFFTMNLFLCDIKNKVQEQEWKSIQKMIYYPWYF